MLYSGVVSQVTCLCCGTIYDASLEMCPRRYLSEHSTEFALAVAKRLLANGIEHPDKRQLLAAIKLEQARHEGHLPGVPS